MDSLSFSTKRNRAYRVRSATDRFWEKVERHGPDGCWGWLAAKDKNGYGVFYLSSSKKNMPAHRFSYELHIGPIPDGMFVCHHCDNPPCCNPNHLFLGTIADNHADMCRKGRLRYGVGHHNSKLTDGDVMDIRAALSAGQNQYDVAVRYGVSQSIISTIWTGKAWLHVKD